MLYTLGDCLCYCNDIPFCYDNYIWLLKEYDQVEKCWSKVRFTITQGYYVSVFVEDYFFGQDHLKRLQPIKVFGNGDMLMLFDEKIFLYYSNKRKIVKKFDLFGKMDDDCYYINSILLTPSFLSLKRYLGMENVMSF
ncbi:hypothetical protein AAHA92_07938 [Salvia divinorum]|uniref:F-box protein n=1 Tax=Salvia divinorum TaxID=28513 RepID=A0ABD1HQK3_SALDI